jgi:carbonic anhydrase
MSRAIAYIAAFSLTVLCGSAASRILLAADAQSAVTPDEARQLLTAGNERFASGKPERPNSGLDRVRSTGKNGQTPFATILSCADSRVPVETVFDRGVGDLFVVRVAGNVADRDVLASMEYATEHLGTRLIVVMGHTHCGAVKAAVDNAQLDGNLPALVDQIQPAVQIVRQKHPDSSGKKLLEQSIEENVRVQIEQVAAKSPPLRRMLEKHEIEITGAVYDIETGRVKWLDKR